MTADIIKKEGKRIAVIVFAALVMALNINSFVHAGDLFPGGATGLTLLLQKAGFLVFQKEIPYTFLNLVINAVPVYIGFRYIGTKFTGYSCLMIVLMGLFTDWCPKLVITYDPLLVSIFGGIVNGLAISLCLHMGATTGGTDFIAMYFTKRTGTDSWNVVLGINVVILGFAGFLFGWDKALYSIIFQYTSIQIVHLMYRSYQQQTLFIVTNKAEEVCHTIAYISNHSATILEGRGAFYQDECALVYSVVSGEEYKRVIQAVREIDDKAFINVVRTEQITGRFYHVPIK